MTAIVWTHLIYLATAAVVILWVGRVLRRHGTEFASTGEERHDRLAGSMAHLLQVGFYLLNFGVINIALKYGGTAGDAQTAIELVSTKLGYILLAVAATHLMMTAVFSSMRRANEIDGRGTADYERWTDRNDRLHDRAAGRV